MLAKRVNYIHNGKSLESLLTFLSGIDYETIAKTDLVDFLAEHKLDDGFFIDIVKSYGNNNSRKIKLNEFRIDLEKSMHFTPQFQNLGCRGFSYKVHEDFRFGVEELLPDINYRIALMPSDDLFYPPRVRRYLRRILINHVKQDGFPSICFSLGQRSIKECFLFVIQSDIVFRTPSFIREHFRGWRKVFMSMVIASLDSECENIYIPLSRDVLKCSHPFKVPKDVPQIWKVIYDQTAVDFGFSLEKDIPPINIQVYENLTPVEVTQMYKLKLN